MPAPSCSVIIPTFNRAAMLCDAVDSVLAQTFADREIIIIDDGSTDDTADVIASRYGDRVRYDCREHAGVSAARNSGAALARGKYLAFLDSDDMWLPEKLARMLPFMESGGFVLGGHLTCIDRGGARAEEPRRCAAPEADGALARPRRAIAEGRFCRTLTFVCAREAFERSGGFPTDFSAAEDTLWAWRMCGLGRVGLLPEFLSVYRVHAGQTDSERSAALSQRIAVRRIMLQTLPEDERDLERPIRGHLGGSLLQLASALRAEGRLREGARTALAAAQADPRVPTMVRSALWFLGRDFRKRPVWRR